MSITKARVVRNSVNLSNATKASMIELLNARLSDALDLYSQLKYAHWNVKGENFYQLHLLFDSIAGHALEQVDTIAERITALGGRALGTVREAAATSNLSEYNLQAFSSAEHLESVANALASQAGASRSAIDIADEAGDVDTSDLFTGVSRELDKDLWFVEAHLSGNAVADQRASHAKG